MARAETAGEQAEQGVRLRDCKWSVMQSSMKKFILPDCTMSWHCTDCENVLWPGLTKMVSKLSKEAAFDSCTTM